MAKRFIRIGATLTALVALALPGTAFARPAQVPPPTVTVAMTNGAADFTG